MYDNHIREKNVYNKVILIIYSDGYKLLHEFLNNYLFDLHIVKIIILLMIRLNEYNYLFSM